VSSFFFSTKGYGKKERQEEDSLRYRELPQSFPLQIAANSDEDRMPDFFSAVR
jgi:hypothetical protein